MGDFVKPHQNNKQLLVIFVRNTSYNLQKAKQELKGGALLPPKLDEAKQELKGGALLPPKLDEAKQELKGGSFASPEA
ncbi:MAG: hypothetical protein FWF76_03040 [Oscillospiraceae bacterium]|nr:hypothetical protein [Oscillospiraceae bacterium]